MFVQKCLYVGLCRLCMYLKSCLIHCHVAVLDHIDFTSHNALLHNRRDGQSISFPRIGSFEQRIETTGFKKRFSDFLIIFEFF